MPVEAKPSKLAKLDGFKRSLPFMTATALSEVVNKIKSEGLPAASSRKDIRDAAQLKLMDKGYGNIIKKMKVACKDGSERDLVFANPLALLQAAFFPRRILLPAGAISARGQALLFQPKLACHVLHG